MLRKKHKMRRYNIKVRRYIILLAKKMHVVTNNISTYNFSFTSPPYTPSQPLLNNEKLNLLFATTDFFS